MEKWFNVAGRALLAQVFVISGLGKIAGYAGTQAYMASAGVPGALLPLVIILELAGGLALLIGFKTRWAALALAAFSIVSAAIFHSNLGDQMQMVMFLKNLALAGGLLVLAQAGALAPAVEARRHFVGAASSPRK